MASHIVQLQIPDRWMLWRVYHAKTDEHVAKDEGWDLQVSWKRLRPYLPGSENYVSHQDPMDECGFDDTTSFPSVKPDRDIFGPPQRGRKQRGWYYVKPWPPTTGTVPHHYATGADIPEELFYNILEHCLADIRNWYRNDAQALRLVCSQWEKMCLRWMFKAITIRNHRDVRSVSALLDWRTACGWTAYPVRSIILNLDLQEAENWRPWAGLSVLLPKLQAIQRSLLVYGPLPAGRRLTSVYLASPHRPHWSPLAVRQLSLFHIHFKKLEDLVRLLRELPYLTTVSGEGITWDASPEEYPRLTSYIPCIDPHSSVEYKLNREQPDLARILVCALSLSGSGAVARNDADILYGLVSSLRPCSSPSACGNYPQRFPGGVFIGTGLHWPHVHVEFEPAQGGTQSVRTISFDFRPTIFQDSNGLRVEKVSWDSIFDFVANLLRDPRPDILLIFLSIESAALFHAECTIPGIAGFIESGRIMYVIEKITVL